MKRASHALAAYVAITIAATWPLARGLGRDVAWDLGDSILNMWILAWDCEQIRAILGGDVSKISTFFDANIFHPASLTLAYSEHLIPQAIQIFPVYLVSSNPILCYNLIFLSTFVLSGLGMYLLVRELTGNGLAGFVAGLLFAFAPYRLPQASHVQVLSSQWMPFVFYGLTRYFETHRVRALAGAAAALVAQNLSCGYYLLYFSPFAAIYALWELWRRGLWRDRRTWLSLSAAGVCVAAATAPFLLPYARLRNELWGARGMAEVSRFSADVYSYATAFSEQRVWGDVMRAYVKPEGELFPGAIPLLLAIVGILLWGGPGVAPRASLTRPAPQERWYRSPWVIVSLAVLSVLHAVGAVVAIAMRRVTIDLWLFPVRLGNVTQLLLRAALLFAAVLWLSPGARARTLLFMRSRGFFLAALVAAWWLSLGPSAATLGRPLDLASPYRLLYEYVPGFSGLRVPARLAMIVVLMLSVLGGYGAAWMAARRWGRAALAVLACLFLLEATHLPLIVNGMSASTRFNLPEARLYRPARAPVIYKEAARLPPDAVLVELPLGYPDFDLRAMYYSLAHHRPILNGYSGFFPVSYGRLTFAVGELPRHPELSLQAVTEGGATHAIVHEGAFLQTEGPDTTAALRQLGATELFRDGTEVLLALPR
jgi:hypothetical protein